ncbi:helix-hairpin-helix domain-containing protein [Siphonobacter sp. SORGH_AS_1065]|uniref:ComEA family DNA-binding protein n=1 Tax=Siphonobacter sp. SORGH_AS_1065 TaxID=3041795 RepID=UPI0027825D66|nr:helix-hairpin-helix domain-containing protein [Siphonobacter sp. SORGH_AS_1065]MDQ1086564.1 hypothetical protein [Siphonobacter sp. SORGH_AS_1065]
MKWLFVFLLLPCISRAQEPVRPEVDPGILVQQLLPNQSENVSEEVLDNLYQLYQQPLNLNDVTLEELTGLYILSEQQLTHFFQYRQQAGPFVSLYELQSIPYFDLVTIQRLLPFVYVDAQRLSGNPNHTLILRYDRSLELRKGFTSDAKGNPRYLGSPYRLFMRYKGYAARNFSLGVTTKQDAGEPFRWNPATRSYGTDYLSFQAHLQNRGRLKSLSVGDYQLQVGQGLVLAGGFYLSKGSEAVLTVRRSQLGIRPYTSSTEYGFFRGLAATVQLSARLEFTGFYSRIRRDANLVDEYTVSSLQTSGLHRTDAEISDKASLQTQDYGGHLRWQNSRVSLGFTYLQTNYDKTLQKANRAYNQYEFSGKTNTLLSLNYSYLWRNLNGFGEIARSASGGIGLVSGVLSSLSKRWDASLIFRHYDRNFHTFYGNSFSENSRPINETGLYAGLKYTPNKRWQVGGYLDYFRFPSLKYLVDQPSQGYGYLLRGTYRPSKTRAWTLQAFFERKEKNIPSRLSKTSFVTPTERSGVWAGYSRDVTARWSLHSRIYYARFSYRNYAPSQGFALIQDARLKMKKVTLTGRLAYFHTNDYDSRIYVYEDDVLAAFSIPAYADVGIRTYALFRYSFSKHLEAWCRISRTQLFNQPTVGSGLDEIPHPHRTDVKVQLRYQW